MIGSKWVNHLTSGTVYKCSEIAGSPHFVNALLCDVTAGCAAKYIAKQNFSQQQLAQKCKNFRKNFPHSFSLSSF
jgi:hypothetical protein